MEQATNKQSPKNTSSTDCEPKTNRNRTRFISEGLESLIHQINKGANSSGDYDFDLIIVGSGYGGSLLAQEMSKRLDAKTRGPLNIAVLERGLEYLPGSFPNTSDELPTKIRATTPSSKTTIGNREGLFDFRLGKGANALVANGLGGGSLINAGVMERPLKRTFQHNWPRKIGQNVDELFRYFSKAEQALGVASGNRKNDISCHQHHAATPLDKFISLKNLSDTPTSDDKFEFREVALSTSMSKHTNLSGLQLNACTLCGDCATGCNHEAKNSLDTNALYEATLRGVKVYTGASVLDISPMTVDKKKNKGWSVAVQHTDKNLSLRQGKPIQLRTKKLIIAAGTFGSTELLMRSRSSSLKFSSVLGKRISTNGDMIAASYGEQEVVNGFANDSLPHTKRFVGPTITGMIDARASKGISIQEMAIPAPLMRFFSEAVTTLSTLDELGDSCLERHKKGCPESDPYAVDWDKLKKTSTYAIMGDDSSEGELSLAWQIKPNQPSSWNDESGSLYIDWKDLPNHPLFEQQIDLLTDLAHRSNKHGKVLPNGTWKALPAKLSYLTDDTKGPLLTVHPLGGCAMADSVSTGVVNDQGQVFNPDTGGTYDNLVVMDGSVIPTSLSINPALTIAALAIRSSESLWTDEWPRASDDVFKEAEKQVKTSRTVIRSTSELADAIEKNSSIQNEVVIHERLQGEYKISDKTYQVLLTCQFFPVQMNSLTGPTTLSIDDTSKHEELAAEISKIQLIELKKYKDLIKQHLNPKDLDAAIMQHADYQSSISGKLEVFFRNSSRKSIRRAKALGSWLQNRAIRDAWQAIESWLSHKLSDRTEIKQSASPIARLKGAWALGSRAGEVRTFNYYLDIKSSNQFTCSDNELRKLLDGKQFTATKTFTYFGKCNPWTQLSEVTIKNFATTPSRNAIHQIFTNFKSRKLKLNLDTKHLAHTGTPLIRMVNHQNQFSALVDLYSMLAYIARLTIGIHSWSLRMPDSPSQSEPERLPQAIKGLPKPEIKDFYIATINESESAKFRLTRYPQTSGNAQPILMIHGYSVGGNTFTHHAIDPNLASFFWKQGWDVWIADFRTSAAFSSALHPWSFEDIALVDIPLAIDHIYKACGNQSIDIMAHCMGAAMFSMSVLSADTPLSCFSSVTTSLTVNLDHLKDARTNLPNRIRKAAFSQMGPSPIMSPDNIFRGYLMHYIGQVVSAQAYSFRRSKEFGLAEQLVDRLLSTLPYPKDEFRIENPVAPWKKTRFVTTRHRMNLLYGRDLKLSNIHPKIFDYFDDLYGALNLETVSQVGYFAQYGLITDKFGRNRFVTRDKIRKNWLFPSLSFHGTENALVDPNSAYRTDHLFKEDAGVDHKSILIEGFGHLDCLIGEGRVESVYSRLEEFYNESPFSTLLSSNEIPESSTKRPQLEKNVDCSLLAIPPWIGPILQHPEITNTSNKGRDCFTYRIAHGPIYCKPLVGVTLPISTRSDGECFLIELCPDWISRIIPDSLNKDHIDLTELKKWTISRGDFKEEWANVIVNHQQLPSDAEGVITLLIENDSEYLRSLYFSEAQGKQRASHAQSVDVKNPNKTVNETLSLESFASGEVYTEDYLQFWKAVLKSIQLTFRKNNRNLNQKVVWLNSLVSQRSSLNLAIGACHYPAGMIDKTIADRSYKRLSERMDSGLHLDGVLLLGDQIYADASAGLFDPKLKQERYNKPHESWLLNRYVSNVARRAPLFCMLDDHEIADNFEPLAPENRKNQERDQLKHFYKDGTEAYFKYQRGLFESRPSTKKIDFAFGLKNIPIFMANTRTERDHRRASSAQTARIMSKSQAKRLNSFLDKCADLGTPSILCCPAAVTPRRKSAIPHSTNDLAFLRSDAWDGFPASLNELLSHIVDKDLRHIILVSGDEHISSLTTLSISNLSTGKNVSIYSIHSSALYAPFPFANSTQAELTTADCWTFELNGFEYQCDTNSSYYPGDGFAILKMLEDDTQSEKIKNWRLNLEFNRHDEQGSILSLAIPIEN